MKKISFAFLLPVLLLLANCKRESTSEPVTPDTEKAVSYLALGDSYTIGESVAPSERFPVLLAEELEEAGIPVEGPVIVAKTGWTTADLQRGIANADLKESGYDLISLLIGVNNQYQGRSMEEYKSEFTALLLRAIDLAGGSKENVFVLSIPDYGYTPFGQSRQETISAEIDRFNAVNKQVIDSIGVQYINITPISRQGLADPALVASDGLHPSGKMYAQWVALLLDEVLQVVEAP